MSRTQRELSKLKNNNSTNTLDINADNINKDIPNGSKLTIYSRSGHMVQRIEAGITSIIIPKSVVLDSVVAINERGVVPFSYVPSLNGALNLTDRTTGEKLNVHVEKGSLIMDGKMVSLDANNVIIIMEGKLVAIHNYDIVSVSGSNDVSQPSLIFTDTTLPLTVSYLLSGIEWTCSGTALIDEANLLLHLRLTGNITNSTEGDITANTTLVSGEVYQNQIKEYDQPQMMMRASQSMRKSSSPMYTEPAPTSSLEDFIRYDIGTRIIRNKDIAELRSTQYPIAKIYVHSTDRKRVTCFGYLFKAIDFIPACSVNCYSITPNKSIDAFIGANNIKESQKDDKVKLMLGETSLVKCSTRVETIKFKSSDRKAGEYKLPKELLDENTKYNVVVETIKTDIHNRNSTSIKLFIKHSIYDRILISGGECGGVPLQREFNSLFWEVEIPANTEMIFECKLVSVESDISIY
jgi:hypothetical protein